MRRIFLISLILQLCILTGLLAQPYSATGKVYTTPDEGITQIGIEGARVYTDFPYSAETFTDANGNYSFTDVPEGTLLTVRVEKLGYNFSPEFYERLLYANASNLDFVGVSTGGTGGGTTTVPVTFYYDAGNATPTNVYLAGSMNGYNAADADYKLLDAGDGIWAITKELEPNDYVYKYVVDGNWVNDPYNPLTDGSQYSNSLLTVGDPMITYFLPAFNESYSGNTLPLIKAIVATSDNSINISDYTLTINGNSIAGTATLSSFNKVLSYTPNISELINGDNTAEISYTSAGKTVTKSISFQYTPASGGSGFTVSGYVLEATKIPLEGVKISNGDSEVYTDATGYYSISGCNSDMTLIASKLSWYFFPDKISLGEYNSDVSNINFEAYGGTNDQTEKYKYTITGKVTLCGNPVEGAEIESRGKLVYTASDGTYSISDSVETNGTFYEPSSVIVNLNAVNFAGEILRQLYLSGISNNYVFTDVDFAGVYAEDTLTGSVSYPSGLPYAEKPLKWELFQGPILSISTPIYDSVIYTDISGNYKAPYFYGFGNGVNEYYTYRISPELNGYQYNPVNIKSDQSCQSLKDKNIEVAFNAVPLCMVTVSDDNHNIVVWEKPETEDIEGFVIYKETNVANEYLPVDTVDYNDIAEYTDIDSDPSVKANRYKLSTILKQDYSVINDAYHKTIHLTISKGIGNSWNLIWTHYEGIEISTYKLYRGTSKENMTFLSDIAGNLNSYTDNTAPEGDVYYQIEMVLTYVCNPEVAKPLLKSTTDGNSYSSAKSNIVNSAYATTVIFSSISDETYIYPNPVENKIYFKSLDENTMFEIYSIEGNLIKQGYLNSFIDVSTFQSGIYHIRIKNNERWETFKFVKK